MCKGVFLTVPEREDCYQGCCPTIIPLSLPQIETIYCYLSFRKTMQREKNKNWLKPTRPKMAEDLTSSRPSASLQTHCNTLAKWHTHQHHDSWQLPWQQPEKPIQGLKRRAASVPGANHNPLLRYSWIFLPLFSKPFILLRPSYIFGVSTQIGLRSWFAN